MLNTGYNQNRVVFMNKILFSGRFLIFFLISGAFFTLSAEQIRLKDGRTLEGTVISRNAEEIQIQTKDGFITIPRSDVAEVSEKVQPADAPPATMGDVMKNFRKNEKTESAPEERSPDQPARGQKEIYRSMAHLRSGIYPGFGQFYQERPLSGTLFVTGFSASLLYYAAMVIQSDSYRTDYRNRADELRKQLYNNQAAPMPVISYFQLFRVMEARNAYTASISRVNSAAALIGGIYLLNHIDVLVFHPAPGVTAGIHTPAPESIGFNLTVRF